MNDVRSAPGVEQHLVSDYARYVTRPSLIVPGKTWRELAGTSCPRCSGLLDVEHGREGSCPRCSLRFIAFGNLFYLWAAAGDSCVPLPAMADGSPTALLPMPRQDHPPASPSSGSTKTPVRSEGAGTPHSIGRAGATCSDGVSTVEIEIFAGAPPEVTRQALRLLAERLRGVSDDLLPEGERALRLPDSLDRHLSLHVVLATRLLGGLVVAVDGIETGGGDTDQPGWQ